MAKEHGSEITRSEAGRTERLPRSMISPFEEMDRMLESFFPAWPRPMRLGRLWSEMSEGYYPKMDVIDRDNEILVRAEIPGVEKDDIDVSVTDNTVTIKGASKREETEEQGNYYRSEIARGAFTRTIALPADVDADKSSATFKNGMLELKLSKLETSKRHSIKVN